MAGKTVAVLGVSFKPATSDTRASPAFTIIDGLLRLGAQVKVYDPQALANAKQVYENRVTYADTALNCLADAECCILVTHWPEFRDFENVVKTQIHNSRLILLTSYMLPKCTTDEVLDTICNHRYTLLKRKFSPEWDVLEARHRARE